MTLSGDQLETAASILRSGGLVAYPTEAVFGIGCDPRNIAALNRLCALKGRDSSKGFLLIAADEDQLNSFVDWSALSAERRQSVLAGWPGPVTWILPRASMIPEALTGKHRGIAVRVTAHPVASQLCRHFGGALVSTSANHSGDLPPRVTSEVLANLGRSDLDAIVNAPVGGLVRPTPIRDAITGQVFRGA